MSSPNPENLWTIIKELKGGQYQPVYLCRDQRKGGLVVCKVFINSGDESTLQPDVEEEVANYDKLLRKRHPNVVHIQGIVSNFPAEDDSVVILGLCNAGTLTAALQQPILIPSAFVLHVLVQGINGLQFLRQQQTSHGDCHTQNVFLHFTKILSVENPEAIVESGTSNDYPNAVLADYGTWVHAERLESRPDFNKLGADLRRYCSSIRIYLTRNAIQQQLTEDVSYWLGRFDQETLNYIAMPELDELLSQFSSGLPHYELLAGPKTLTPEFATYFTQASRDLVDVAAAEGGARLGYWSQKRRPWRQRR